MRSMTGVSNLSRKFDEFEVSVDMKSVNTRFFDFSLKSNYEFDSSLELWFEKTAQTNLLRGKVFVNINIHFYTKNLDSFQFNHDMLYYYDKMIGDLASQSFDFLSCDNLTFSELLNLPGVLEQKEVKLSDEMVEEIQQLFSDAIQKLIEYQSSEGLALQAAMLSYVENIEASIPIFEEQRQLADEAFIERLKERIVTLTDSADYDESRILQEIAIQAEKSTIEEELVRLSAHLSSFKNLLMEESAIGRKLDFLTQELNREVNTIGSKVKSLNLTEEVIVAKENIENIREQLQNVV